MGFYMLTQLIRDDESDVRKKHIKLVGLEKMTVAEEKREKKTC